jgi:hypothetical protein
MGEETCPRQWGFRFFAPSPRRIQTWQAPPSDISLTKASLPTPGGLWSMSRSERLSPLRGQSDNNACAETKSMSVNRIPPTPLYKRGLYMGFLTGKRLSSPFLKGDRGGFCCAAVFLKTTTAYSTPQTKRNDTTRTAGGF